MENLGITIILINVIKGLGVYILALVAIIASVQAIKYRKWVAYFCLVTSVFVIILALISHPLYVYVIFYLMMLVGVVFVWLSLRKSEKKSERVIAILLIILLALQLILPFISGFLTALSQ